MYLSKEPSLPSFFSPYKIPTQFPWNSVFGKTCFRKTHFVSLILPVILERYSSIKMWSLRKVITQWWANLGWKPNCGSLAATLKSWGTQGTAPTHHGVVGPDGPSFHSDCTRVHCVPLGQLTSSLSASCSKCKMRCLPSKAAETLVKHLDVVVTVAVAMDLCTMCPASWVAWQGCSWGPALGGSHRMKEEQTTGLSHLCPSREKSPNFPEWQHPESSSSWEQHRGRALGKWLVSAQGYGDFVQGLVTEHAPPQTGRLWALWGIGGGVSREDSSLCTVLVNVLLTPAFSLLQVASLSQSSESSLVLMDWFRHLSSFSLLL